MLCHIDAGMHFEMEGRHESGLVVSCFNNKANINFIAKILCGNIMNMISE